MKKLIKIAEHELGVHHQIKPDKLMPRKKEFATEICNLIGMAHLDKLKLPPNWEKLSDLKSKSSDIELVASILNVSFVDKYAVIPYVFGDQSTYRDPGEPNTSFLEFKKNTNRLEDRIRHSIMALEICYLYHEMGKQNLSQTKFDETRTFGRKVIEEAQNARSFLWEFLGQICICRADMMQKNYVKLNDSLKVALTLAEVFENPELLECFSIALNVSDLIEMQWHHKLTFHFQTSERLL